MGPQIAQGGCGAPLLNPSSYPTVSLPISLHPSVLQILLLEGESPSWSRDAGGTWVTKAQGTTPTLEPWPGPRARQGEAAGRARREALTDGCRLVLAAAEGGRHTEAVLDQLAGGAPAAGPAACRAWLARAPGRQVQTGAGTGPPAGEKAPATPTLCGGREAERADPEQSPSCRVPALRGQPSCLAPTSLVFHLVPGPGRE